MVRVLLAEDDCDYKRIFESELIEEGFEVECVESGEELIERVLIGGIDIIVSDTDLEGKSGDIACGILREQGLLENVLVLGMSLDRDADVFWEGQGYAFSYKDGTREHGPES